MGLRCFTGTWRGEVVKPHKALAVLTLAPLTLAIASCGANSSSTTEAAASPMSAAPVAASGSPSTVEELHQQQRAAVLEFIDGEVGSCWTAHDSLASSWRVDCEQPHRHEIVHRWSELPESGPSDEAVESYAERCRRILGDRSPRDDGNSRIGIARVIVPPVDDWENAVTTASEVSFACSWQYVQDQTGFEQGELIR